VFDILAITGPIYLVVAAGYLSTRLGLFERGEMRVRTPRPNRALPGDRPQIAATS
jgi:hypothetical protein